MAHRIFHDKKKRDHHEHFGLPARIFRYMAIAILVSWLGIVLMAVLNALDIGHRRVSVSAGEPPWKESTTLEGTARLLGGNSGAEVSQDELVRRLAVALADAVAAQGARREL